MAHLFTVASAADVFALSTIVLSIALVIVAIAALDHKGR